MIDFTWDFVERMAGRWFLDKHVDLTKARAFQENSAPKNLRTAGGPTWLKNPSQGIREIESLVISSTIVKGKKLKGIPHCEFKIVALNSISWIA